MRFQTLGNVASVLLSDLADKRAATREPALVTFESGEIERVSFLRATDQKRRVDASLLTGNFESNWSVAAQGNERWRQAHLLERTRRQLSPGRTRRLS